MIHICICDDSDAMRDELCGLIQGLCQKHSIAASVSCCSSGEELLFDPDDKNRTTDIFFLDILMKKLNGIMMMEMCMFSMRMYMPMSFSDELPSNE